MNERSITLSTENRINWTTSRFAAGNGAEEGLSFHFIFSETEHYQFGNKQLRLYPQQFLVLNQGTTYQYHLDATDRVSRFVLHYNARYVSDMLNTLSTNTGDLTDQSPAQPACASLLPFMLYPFKNDIYYNACHLRRAVESELLDDLLLSEYLYYSLQSFIGLYQAEVLQPCLALSSNRAATRQELIRRLSIAKDFIRSNFNQPIQLEAIAQECFLSVNHLMRCFKQAFGKTPYQYLTEIRLEHARSLVTRSDYPINEIALLIGFENTSAFIRLYRSYFHITPYQNRKQAA